MMFNQTGNSFTHRMNIEGTTALLDESGTLEEEDYEKILKNKQALLANLQLADDDPLKKLMSN